MIRRQNILQTQTMVQTKRRSCQVVAIVLSLIVPNISRAESGLDRLTISVPTTNRAEIYQGRRAGFACFKGSPIASLTEKLEDYKKILQYEDCLSKIVQDV